MNILESLVGIAKKKKQEVQQWVAPTANTQRATQSIQNASQQLLAPGGARYGALAQAPARQQFNIAQATRNPYINPAVMPRQSFGNKLVDQFSANTPSDNYRRFNTPQAGLERSQDAIFKQNLQDIRSQVVAGKLTQNQARGAALSAAPSATFDYNKQFQPTNVVAGLGQKVINVTGNRVTAPVSLGIGRSVAGTGEGLSGLYDLATPGLGNNRFGKTATKAGQATDRVVKDQNYNKALYKGAQAATDVGTFLLPGAIANKVGSIPKVASITSKVGNVASKAPGVAKVTTKLAGVSSKLGTISKEGNAAQRVGAKLASSYLKPGTITNVGADVLQSTGLRTNRGIDNNAGTLATDIGTSLAFQGGMNLGGQALGGVAKPVISKLKDTNLIRPSSLNPNEVADLANFRQRAGGPGMDEATYQKGIQAAQKAGVDYQDPTAVDNLLGAHRTFDTRQAGRKEAVRNVVESVKTPTMLDEVGAVQIPGRKPQPKNPLADLPVKREVPNFNDPGVKLPKKETFEQSMARQKQVASKEIEAMAKKAKSPKELATMSNGPHFRAMQDFQSPETKAIGEKIKPGFDPNRDYYHQKVYEDYYNKVNSPQPPKATKRIKQAEDAYIDERITADQLEAIRNKAEVTPPKILDPSEPGSKVRGFVKTAVESPNTDAPVTRGIKGTYDPITNKQSFAKADATIDKDFEAAVTRAKTSSRGTTENQAIGLRVMDELQAKGRYEDAIDVVEKIAERATATGQATQILSAYNRLQPEGILLAAEREIRKAKNLNPEKYKNLKLSPEQAGNLRKLAEDIKAMPEGDEKTQATRAMLDEIAKVVPTSGARKFTTLWKAGLLTGVKGAVGGNNVGNMTSVLLRKLSDVPAAGIDNALALIYKRRSKVFTLKGIASGFGEGVKVGYKNFKNGGGASDLTTKFDYKKTFYGNGPLGKAAQKYTDTVFNFYSAADRPYFHSALKNSLYDLAKVEGKNQGLHGKPFKDFVEKTVKEPSEDILTQAHEVAERATFQNKNALGAALSGAKRGAAEKGGAAGEVVGEVALPFTGVPSSVASAVYNYSPAGATVQTYKAIKQAATGNFDQAAQRKLTEALGTGITGTGLMWLGATLTSSGQMTLGLPSDPQERALWEAEGKTPYSIQLGGKWRSLNYTGPAMALLAVGGQVHRAGKEGASGANKISQGIAASGKAIIGSSPLQGIQSGLDAITSPDRYAERYKQNLASSVVPTLVKDVANAGDKKIREVNSVKDALQNKIPGLKNKLMEKRDVFGQPLDRKTSTVGTLIDPFKSSKATTDPLTDEMRRLQDAKQGAVPSKIDKKFTIGGKGNKQELVLDNKQLNAYQAQVGQATKDGWGKIVADPRYRELDDTGKKNKLEEFTKNIRAVELKKFQSTNKIGEYSQDFSGNPSELTAEQQRLAEGGSLFKDKEVATVKLPKGRKTKRAVASRGGSRGRRGSRGSRGTRVAKVARLKPSDFKLPYHNLIRSSSKGAALARSAKLARRK